MLFLIPLLVAGLLIRQMFHLARKVAAPLANIVPVEHVAGIVVADLIAGALLLGLAFLLGLIARTRPGSYLKEKLEMLVLKRMPGYTLLKNLENVDDKRIVVALLQSGDRKQLGLIMEKLDNGMFVVFIPGAPNPTSGSVFFMDPSQVQPTDMSLSEVAKFCMQMGTNSRKFFHSPYFQNR